MREMVFNDASARQKARSGHEVAPLLCDIVKGMAALCEGRVTSRVLRFRINIFEIECAPGSNLYEVTQLLRRLDRDAAQFFQSLAQKAPLLDGLPDDQVAKFNGAQAIDFAAEEGEPLLLCALTGAVSVSLPLAPEWDTAVVSVEFQELDPKGELVERESEIDNLARADHAPSIRERARIGERSGLSRETFWERRATMFPSLSFGLDVETQMAGLDAEIFPVAMNKLEALHEAARKWLEVGGASPPWTCRVTGESMSTMADERLRQARIFRGPAGELRLYEWHARCGNSGRIHLAFDPSTRRVEIGYIGRHLPL